MTQQGTSAERLLGAEFDPPGSRLLRFTFFVLVLIDAIAATLFFKVPHAEELNPVTVLSYQAIGTPGVAVAATCYAAIVMALGHVLPEPWDVRFVGAVSVMYAVFAINNVPLLLYEQAVVFTFL